MGALSTRLTALRERLWRKSLLREEAGADGEERAIAEISAKSLTEME